jgi:glycosyltransferase involved in cell wall biosynthesis
MLTLLVEGWRFIPQSYALVNQHQCLELLCRTNVTLYHNDIPFFYPYWKAQRGLLPQAQENRLAALHASPSGADLDAVLRIYVPYEFGPSRARRTYVFMTCEMGVVPPSGLRGTNRLRDALKGSDVVLITPSKWSERGLVHDGADESRIRIVPHGVDINVYRPLASEQRSVVRERLGWKDGFIFLNTSAMTDNKGIPLLLKSFAAVANRHPHARLVLKGLDSLYKSQDLLMSVARGLSAEELRVIQPRLGYLGGNATQREMIELFQAADAYVSPYLGEGFNLPVLEAIACGLPAICTQGGSTEDFITSETALRIESEMRSLTTPEGQEKYYLMPDQDHLTVLMTQVIEDEHWRLGVRSAGPAHVQSRYTWAIVVDRLLEVLS